MANRGQMIRHAVLLTYLIQWVRNVWRILLIRNNLLHWLPKYLHAPLTYRRRFRSEGKWGIPTRLCTLHPCWIGTGDVIFPSHLCYLFPLSLPVWSHAFAAEGQRQAPRVFPRQQGWIGCDPNWTQPFWAMGMRAIVLPTDISWFYPSVKRNWCEDYWTRHMESLLYACIWYT